MTILALAAAVFVLSHLLIAGTSLRDRLAHLLGEGGYTIVYSLISIAAIVWLCRVYAQMMPGTTTDPILWLAPRGLHDSGLLVVALAFFLGVQGLLLRNPTAVAQAGAASDPHVVQGVMRITRHPFLWGVALWAAFHLAANGDAASQIFFGAFLVLAVLGTVSIDAKRRRKMGTAWQDFASRTSNIPFAAILTGRVKADVTQWLGWRFLIAALLFAVLIVAHLYLFGVSPFPGGWRPY